MNSRCALRLPAILVCLLALAKAEPAWSAIEFSKGVVLERVGQAGRRAIHTDEVERQIVLGQWQVPSAGDEVELPDGSTKKWEAAEADEKGWFTQPALRGGYLLVTHDAPQRRVMLLEAAGHSMVYVNGAPRAGDPYRTGFVRLPVLLEEGRNTFLFQVSRGGVSAKLAEPTSQVMISEGDPTLPGLLVGEPIDTPAAVVVINVSTEVKTGLVLSATDLAGGVSVRTAVPAIPPLSVRKCGFTLNGPAPTEPEPRELEVELLEVERDGQEIVHDSRVFELKVRQPGDLHVRTFVSAIDGSVQYYAVRPASTNEAQGASPPAMVLSLHGASVQGRRQASAYKSRPWCHVVAPTNRRPFGFDWEDWGRLDALEVLDLAERRYQTDRQRTYLTGHSMGGHGTWILGASFPDRFAAIAPSAGWISFWSYAGTERYQGDPIEQVLRRATSGSDTLALAANLRQQGIYVLHGDADDNVPVEQARRMRTRLAEDHPNFAYYERPGAGHWWGDQCMDWPPLFRFLQDNTLPAPGTVDHVDFVTASPGISATCHWVTVADQERPFEISHVDVHLDEQQRIHGTTDNVAVLGIDLGPLVAAEVLSRESALTIELDGDSISPANWPADDQLWLKREDSRWRLSRAPDLAHKGPHRFGSFKDAFRHRVQLVYGTKGNKAENAWALAKAKFDAETFWYRGNGSLEVLADVDFDSEAEPDRSVVLYGNADTNEAWSSLIDPQGPIDVKRGHLRIGRRRLASDQLGGLFIRPRPGSDRASVGAVTGTGVIGMRCTDRLPYFVSGVGYPDCIIVEPEMLRTGTAGVVATGYFGSDWSVENGEIEFSAESAGGDR